MNIDQIKKHGEVMKWFISNPVKGVWYYFHENEGWVLTYDPQWCKDSIYMQNDDYSNLRKAQVDGKEIEACDACYKNYSDVTAPALFNLPADRYRIKPDTPKFKPGDWVVHKVYGDILQVLKVLPCDRYRDNVHIKNGGAYFDTELNPWEPHVGELCVFWCEIDSYYIGRYSSIIKGDTHPYKDAIGYSVSGWDNIAPLEFAMTLRSS